MSRGGRTEQDLKMARGEGKAVKVRQLQSYDCGAACLGSVAGWYGVYWPLIKIRYLCGCTEEGISVKGIMDGAVKMGFYAKAYKSPEKETAVFREARIPIIVHIRTELNMLHFVTVYGLSGGKVKIMDPASGEFRKVPVEVFKEQWTGILILITPGNNFRKEGGRRKGLTDFYKILLFHKKEMLLLLLGSLIVISAGRHGAALPGAPDDLLPWYTKCFAPPYASAILVIGIISASFSSADSALTSVTTSLYIDFLKGKGGGRLKRNALHFAVCAVFALLVIAFKYISDKSIIDTIYTIVGYAYGPLLGLFAYGLLTHRRVIDRCVPFIAILSPAACFLTERACAAVGYRFGYELLILNGLITFAALYATSLFAKGKAEAMPATQTDDKQIH